MKSLPISKCVRWVTLRNSVSLDVFHLLSSPYILKGIPVIEVMCLRSANRGRRCKKVPVVSCNQTSEIRHLVSAALFFSWRKNPLEVCNSIIQITRRHLVCVWCFFFISFSAVKNLHPYKQVLNSNAEQEYVLNTLLMWRKWLLQTSTRTREIMEQQKKQQPNTDKPVKWIQ